MSLTESESAYDERVEITLPNGDVHSALVTVKQEEVGWWTTILPDEAAVVPASGIGAEVGDTHDFIYDVSARGVVSPGLMVAHYIRAWKRAQDD